MRARLRTVAFALASALGACGGDDGAGDGRPIDARFDDGPVDAPPIDAPRDAPPGNGTLCEGVDPACQLPEHCCLAAAGSDCVPGNTGQCAGEELACDGPEDCGVGLDCCWFEGQGSRCIVGGNCGFTGAISAPMCHTQTDCLSFPSCCPQTPAGAPTALYRTCAFNACP